MSFRLPFNEEINSDNMYPSIRPGEPGAKKRNTPISPRENLARLFKGEKPMWIPLASDLNAFGPKLIPDNISRAMIMEAEMMAPADCGGPDWFGVQWEFVPVAGGSMVQPGNPKVKELMEWEKYISFPDLDKLDWMGSAKRNAEFLAGDRPCNMTIFTGLFERLISFIDFEDAAVALIDEDEQEAVHRLFDKLADFYIDLIAHCVKYYHAEIITFHDDWGSQRSPFFSSETWKEMILPYLKRIIDATHALGLIFELHSCGMIEPLVPLFIEAGVDTWRGQPMNDKKRLVHEYGDRFIFGVEVEAPRGASDDEIYKCAVDFVREYGDKPVIAVPRCADRERINLLADCIYALGRQHFSS